MGALSPTLAVRNMKETGVAVLKRSILKGQSIFKNNPFPLF